MFNKKLLIKNYIVDCTQLPPQDTDKKTNNYIQVYINNIILHFLCYSNFQNY